MKLNFKLLSMDFQTQTVENKKSREEEAEKRKEYIAGLDDSLQINSSFTRWEWNTVL